MGYRGLVVSATIKVGLLYGEDGGGGVVGVQATRLRQRIWISFLFVYSLPFVTLERSVTILVEVSPVNIDMRNPARRELKSP